MIQGPGRYFLGLLGTSLGVLVCACFIVSVCVLLASMLHSMIQTKHEHGSTLPFTMKDLAATCSNLPDWLENPNG